MKTNLTDITFLILVRLDSINRLENILCVIDRFTYYFNTNIVIREADSYNNGVLQCLLNRYIRYEFIEDKDPVLYKTKHINQMAKFVTTPYISIWDADIIPDKKAIIESISHLRNEKADVAYPYNGICYDISQLIKSLYFKKKDVRLLHRQKNKMERLYSHPLVGGAVIMNREKYLAAGGENEKHYGWGNDDFDRFYRFIGLGYKIYWVSTSLFHLSHLRGQNSQFRSNVSKKISSTERTLIVNSSKYEIELKYNIPKAEKVI